MGTEEGGRLVVIRGCRREVEGGGGDIKQYWEGRLTLIPYYISCHINKIETIEEFTIKYDTAICLKEIKTEKCSKYFPEK